MKILYLPNSYSQQRQKEKPSHIYPVRMAMECAKYCKEGHEVYWGKEPLELVALPSGGAACKTILMDKVITEPENLSFLTLPRPDRVFTRAKEYTSGNYKYLPGTHIMSASGCWHGKCSFCVENKEVCSCYANQNNRVDHEIANGILSCGTCGKPISKPNYEVRPVEDVISEIEECRRLGFKEVFDDSATFPMGEWLERFTNLLPKTGIVFSCNMRIGSVVDYNSLKQAGFRMLLFGIESANQYTLDKINKGVKVEDIIPVLKAATRAKLDCHGAFMFGYPWETVEDAERTLKLCHYLLRKGYLKTAQASLYCPQGVPGNQAHKKYVKKIYDVGFDPRFWVKRIGDIRSVEDINYIWRGIKSWLG